VGNNRGSQTGGPEGQIKNYSHANLLKEAELKVALTGSTGGHKAARQRKQRLRKKERRLLYAPTLGRFTIKVVYKGAQLSKRQ
jgi:hypothetical protein